ncbi:MAG: Hpt domain-containing protein [Acidimicrobiales bacterium]
MDDLEGDGELIEAFVVESRESLDAIDDALLDLESKPNDLELVREIFRRIHSVKGASGFLGLVTVESVSHSGEHLLSKVRDGEIAFNEEIASALLETVDTLRTIFDQLESDGTEGSATYQPLLDRLAQLRDGDAAEVGSLDDANEPATVDEEPTSAVGDGVEPADNDLPPIPNPPHAPNPIGGRSPVGRVLVEGGLITEAQLNEALDFQRAGDHRRLGELVAALGYTTMGEVEALINAFLDNFGAEISDPETQQRTKANADSSIRVDLEVLDGIVGLVGELVLARNQIVQATDSGATDIGRMASELAYITSSLQEQALRTRMQRIESAWRSLPRVVRDVSKATGKGAQLVMSGEGIELDRTIIEAIRDPLVHLVRNAVDHGLESPEVRAEAGKPAQGTIRLSAIQDGGHVIIEVADDGGGIDPYRIAQSALEKRLITQSELDTMTDTERVELILRPGFSTATEVTKISGRGVGMDVVASNLKEIRGTLEIRSELGGNRHSSGDPAHPGHRAGARGVERRPDLRHPASQRRRARPSSGGRPS